MENRKFTEIPLKSEIRILFNHLSSGKMWISFEGISTPSIKDIVKSIFYKI